MRTSLSVFGALLTLLHLSYAQDIIYVSPKPNSNHNTKETNIIIRFSRDVTPNEFGSLRIKVRGSVSEDHDGKLFLSDDLRTIIFNPAQEFAPNEAVEVVVTRGSQSHFYSFSFTISPNTPLPRFSDNEYGISPSPGPVQKTSDSAIQDSLPPDLAPIKIGVVDRPARGNIIFSIYNSTDKYKRYALILNDSGKVLKYKKLAANEGFDFNCQPNGFLSYAIDLDTNVWFSKTVYYTLDTNLVPIDSFKCKNGYYAEHHDFKILPNGHVLFLAFDARQIDMSKIVQGGKADATVVGSVIQELDQARNVCFQWRSFDHIPFMETFYDTTASIIMYMRSNSVDLDSDGNLLLSSRNISEVTKISRVTGNIIWRLGGRKNQFKFIGENEANKPYYFSYPHDIRKLPNGNITLLDNGFQHTGVNKLTRAVEYRLDEISKTATLVWEYNTGIFANAMGSVQRLPNGNTLIGVGAGGVTNEKTIIEVHPDKTIAFELALPKGLVCNRAYRYEWKPEIPGVAETKYEILPTNVYDFNTVGVRMVFSMLRGLYYNRLTINRYRYAPLNPDFEKNAPILMPVRLTIAANGIDTMNCTVTVDTTFFRDYPSSIRFQAFLREKEGSGVFKSLVSTYDQTKKTLVFSTDKFGEVVFGYPDIVTDVKSSAVAPEHHTLHQNYPNPFNPSTTISYEIPTASHVGLKIFNTLGQVVATLVDERKDAGFHQVRWKADVPSGVYFYRWQAGDFVETKKLILTK